MQEGWGLVVLEAIAAELPVITSNQPPFTEFLSETQALLIDPNEPIQIAQAMRLITEPPLSRAIIQNSQSILPHYSWETSARKHLEVYYTLVKEGGKAIR